MPNEQPADLTWSYDQTHYYFSFIKWRSDVTYYVLTSFDLLNWTTNGITQVESGETVTASVPIGTNQCRFMRLAVSYP